MDSLSNIDSRSLRNRIDVWLIELNTRKIMNSSRYFTPSNVEADPSISQKEHLAQEETEFNKFEIIEPYSKFPIPLDIVVYEHGTVFMVSTDNI